MRAKGLTLGRSMRSEMRFARSVTSCADDEGSEEANRLIQGANMTVRRAAGAVIAIMVTLGTGGCSSDVDSIPESIHEQMTEASQPGMQMWEPRVTGGASPASPVIEVSARRLPPCSRWDAGVPDSDAPDVSADLEVKDFSWSLERDGRNVIARQITVYPTERLAEVWMSEFPQDHLGKCEEIGGEPVTAAFEQSWTPSALDPIGNVALDQSEFAAMTYRVRQEGSGADASAGTTGAVVARAGNAVALVAVYYPGYRPKQQASDSTRWVRSLSRYAAPTVEKMGNMVEAQ